MSKSKIFAIMGVVILLITASCAPLAETPAPVPTPVLSVAVVQSVEVQIMESEPLQANAVVRGQLPDAGCTTISSVNQVRDGNTIKVVLMTTTDPLELCAQALTPFEQVIALDINNLPAAKYTLNVNGVEQTFELLPSSVSRFQQVLADALNRRDYDLLKILMDDSFIIAYWLSERITNSPDSAIDQLRTNLLNSTSSITPDYSKNLIELLGADPISIVDSQVVGVDALFVSGLGPEGKDEAILYTAKLPNGGLYWYGVLLVKDGFKNAGAPPVVDLTAYPTDIQNVTAEQDINIYGGPGSNFPLVGNLYRGQVAVVSGASADGGWWRVICANGIAGECWVSADRSLTRPSSILPINQPVPEPEKIPTITILTVIKDDQVTIRTQNLPADTKFFVRMGKIGTNGVDGILIDKFNSKKGGSITATFDIPGKLYGEKKISIRLESEAGYYSYNWFDNVTSVSSTPNPTDPQPTDVAYIIIWNSVPVYAGPGVKYGEIGSLAEGKIVKVTGISVDGKWWRVVCSNNGVSNCWVTTKTKFTRPTDGN